MWEIRNNIEGSSPLFQSALLGFFILLGEILCCSLRGRLNFNVPLLALRVRPPMAAEHAARKQFVDEHLVVWQWKRKQSNNVVDGDDDDFERKDTETIESEDIEDGLSKGETVSVETGEAEEAHANG